MNTFTTDTASLRKAVGTVKPAAYKRLSGGLPALCWVKVESDGRRAQLTCTDLDLTATVEVDAPGDAFTFCVDVKALAASIPAGKGICTVSEDSGYVTFSFGASAPSFTLPAMPVDEYPRTSHVQSADERSIAVAPFVDVLPAVGRDEARPILCQVFLDGHKVVATDSYRLHLAVRDTPEPSYNCLVPGKLLRQVVAAAKSQKLERFHLWVEGDGPASRIVTAQVGSLTISAVICQGEFPNYGHLIPGALPYVLDLTGAGQVIAASHKADKDKPVRFVLNGSVHAAGAEGVVEMDLPWGQTTVNEATIAYRPEYLRDALAGTAGLLEYVDGLKPAVVRHAGGLRLLMPVRVS